MADWMRNTVETTLGPARLYVQNRTGTRTPTGGTTYAYADGFWSYTNIAPMTTDELEHAGAMGIHAQVAARVSFDLDVDAEMQVRVQDSGADELEGVWSVKAVMTGFPAVDRLLYLARIV